LLELFELELDEPLEERFEPELDELLELEFEEPLELEFEEPLELAFEEPLELEFEEPLELEFEEPLELEFEEPLELEFEDELPAVRQTGSMSAVEPRRSRNVPAAPLGAGISTMATGLAPSPPSGAVAACAAVAATPMAEAIVVTVRDFLMECNSSCRSEMTAWPEAAITFRTRRSGGYSLTGCFFSLLIAGRLSARHVHERFADRNSRLRQEVRS
jgi:hypothetical protein